MAKNGLLKANLSKDILAGVVVGIVAIPLAIAFAVASGVTPQQGLITAVIAGFLISFFGGSRVQIGGPTGAFIVIVYGIIEQYGIDGMIISTMLAGLFMIGFGLLKMGTLLKYIPHPLVVGFTSAIALVIFSTQIPSAFGMDLGGESAPSEFIEKWIFYFHHFDTINIWSVAITIATILITITLPRFTSRVPGSFAALIVVTPIVALSGVNVDTIGSMFGEMTLGLNVSIPHFDIHNLSGYLQPAFTIAILGSIESLLSAVVADGMISGRHRSNTELIAQGIANVVTPIFGGIPATGAIARTATNVKNGGRSPISGLTHAVVILLIVLFFGKWASYIPMSCLAGVLIVVSYNMSEWRSFRSVLKVSFFDRAILLVTFFLTVLVDLTVALEIGVVLAALLFMKRVADNAPEGVVAAQDAVDQDILVAHPDTPSCVGIYEISGPFFFGSAKRYCETIRSMSIQYHVLIIRMRHVPFVDATALKNLTETITQLKNQRSIIILTGVNDQVRKDLLGQKIDELIGVENIYSNFDEGHAAALSIVRAEGLIK